MDVVVVVVVVVVVREVVVPAARDDVRPRIRRRRTARVPNTYINTSTAVYHRTTRTR